MKFTAVILLVSFLAGSWSARGAAPASDSKAFFEATKDFSAHIQLGQYKEAVSAYERAREISRAAKTGFEFGLPAHELPKLALAYERTGSASQAMEVMKAVRTVIADAKKYIPYGTRSLESNLANLEAKATDSTVKSEVKRIMTELAAQKSKR